MSLIAWDGLDPYKSLAEFASANPRYLGAFYGAPEYFYTTGGRFGGSRLYIDGNNNNCWMFDVSDKAVSQIWTGRAQNIPTSGATANTYLFVARSNTGIEATVTVETDGTIKAYRGDRITLLANSASGVLVRDQWLWLDFFYNMSSSAGGFEVWVNNVQVINLTGANTKQFGSTSNNIISSATIATAQYASNDDYYILDTTGSYPWNTRLGDSRVVNLIPIGDYGANSGTPSTGTTHWGVLDDIVQIDTSDYLSIPVSSSTNTERFLKSISPLSTNSSILAISLYNYSLKSDAGIANLTPVIINNSSGYVANGNTFSVGTGWQSYNHYFQTNPETSGQWTYSQLNSAHIALVVTK